mmetsp:Transcript_8212/g.14862  ORF Transcript_8212/g.14862 Transcript_8212/m.14862 type:complete len:211 (-) Transcript_8212:51-683(-)|eukprot:CAMPEP_0182444862 /NCGR_PEP_ID=MMETSP1172-20130603/3170_1 /TAXON_ID=708627 /ORGANISM="Timspurckia oligopyrenoides, Strain CCMP3278" /LENGTH=210 /DNA_ID=CAMNT_0024640509 /DNA_START=53 /DNA_END=685 /DNA_ORIENTATION=+
MNCAFVSGFGGQSLTAGVARSNVCARRGSSVMMVEKSASIPFLERPSGLDGGVGDVGFDPLGFSNFVDIKFLREAELKHGRICMLAALGWLVQEFYTFPFYAGAPKLPTEAHDYFVNGALNQVLVFASFFEIVAGVPALLQMMQGSGREPGYFAFDPLKLGKDSAAMQRFKLNEIKNGRLAMIAIGGLVHQAWLTKMGGIEQLMAGKILP